MSITTLYWLNHKFKILSDLIIGNTFEPKFDIVCVTGGSTGLGKEIVKQIADRGARVVVLDLIVPDDQDKIPNATYYKCDVSDRQQILDSQKQISQQIGTVTVLINNAGITTGRTVLDLSFQEIEKTIQINLLSSFYTIKAFLPDMLNLKRGYIVTIASVLGYMSPARLSAYGASKSGLIALHESLTYELGPPSVNPHGVKTLLICPGQLRTNMFQGVATPSKVLAPELEPEFVASCVVSAIEQGRRGEIKLPLYGKFIPLFRAMPWPIVELTRKISGIDKSMNHFKDKLSRVASSVASIASRSKNPSLLGTPAAVGPSKNLLARASSSAVAQKHSAHTL
ncbi:uncharacterized protein SPAPADRAFT_73554 [Spathaspora passalidarum NRRL Y-27907]|uniref:Short-chain dehydrogenase/reductase 3 n=1 Tax=Spathaspora passalidarum (strain NRRL Y-27907 / 11-Y1) TaxID=619300 RepID=G3AVF2_SPAPN|nr:uncharacterized protein SPAPADRAFT_73554 [Spathaspora passalidarum NRRL Y-27907]EGW30171.1 hypothetical protein SPAPADRAFT_73554 [Spathaspora passalidarum NRRL Y-27907]